MCQQLTSNISDKVNYNVAATATRPHQIQKSLVWICRHVNVDERLDLLRALAAPYSVSALGDGASRLAYALRHKSTRGRQRRRGKRTIGP